MEGTGRWKMLCGVGKSTRGCSLLSNAGFLLPELKVPVLRAPWGHWQSSRGCVTPKGAPGKAPGAASPPPCAHPGERKASELPQLSCEEQDCKIRGGCTSKSRHGGLSSPHGCHLGSAATVPRGQGTVPPPWGGCASLPRAQGD